MPDPHRLPRTVTPERYDLVLEPDLDEATFRGIARIEVDVAEPVEEVVLNAADLDLTLARLEGPDGETIAAAVHLDDETERATLACDRAVVAGRWTVHTEFSGVLNDKLKGFYRSTYGDDDGIARTIATTQFEATDARRAFPCWDEPDFKAVFGVTLVVADDLTAVSNAREIERVAEPDGRARVRFADTMPMSTYLVAFVVGPLEVTAPVDVDGVPLRVVHVPGKADLTDFALETGAFCLRFFADYYGIRYPGDKLDLVAIPDFAFGAMENLGCVTFREVLLLVDPSQATQPELQQVVDVIAHELAHMWFGDLVTMGWWNGIWLNEAFATFMEMLATDAFHPEWDRWTSFGASRSAAFDTDSLASTRPIEYEVVSPTDAEGMFDILTYEKGASVVRMLEQYLGPENFRPGIRRYLTTHQFANTETTDLWDALEEASGQPTRRIMDSWIYAPGFPVLDAGLADGTLTLRQSRFSYAGDLEGGRWVVPVVWRAFAEGAQRVEKALVDAEELTVDLDGFDHVVVNAGGDGFYRVRYDDDLLDRLAAAAASLSPLERFCLVDDAWALTLAGDRPAAAHLTLVDHFSEEDDLSVWQRLLGGAATIDRLVDGEAGDRLAAIVRASTEPTRTRLGADRRAEDTDRQRELRGALFRALGGLGRDPEARRRARALVDDDDADPALQAAAVSVVADTGDPADFDLFLDRFETAATPQDQQRYLYALADFEDEALARRVHELALSDRVRSQNAPFVLRRALLNRTQGENAWDFVTAHWDAVAEKLPSNSVGRMLEGISALTGRADDVAAFIAEHPIPQAARTVDQHLERLRVNVALRARERGRLEEALLG